MNEEESLRPNSTMQQTKTDGTSSAQRSVSAELCKPQHNEEPDKKRSRRQVTIIGQPRSKLPQLIQQVEQQHKMASKQKLVKPQHIEPIHLNKYVGYHSAHLSVTLSTTVARVKHLCKEMGSKEVNLQKFKIVIDRFSGKVEMHSYSSIDSLSAMIEQFQKHQLIHCRKAMLTVTASDQTIRANRFHRIEESKTSSDKQGNSMERLLRTEVGQSYQNAIAPGFHYLALVLQIKSSINDYLFFVAKRREERDILMHELNIVCTKSNEEVEMFSARGEVMSKIDPIASFNAWNLSIACGPFSRHLEQFHTNGLKAFNGSVAEQAHILKAETDYVVYIRDGIRCFVSGTLRKELYITDGDLWKESATRMVSIKGKYKALFISINFTKNLVESKATRGDESHDGKSIPFSEILEVSRLELDIFKGEHKIPAKTHEFRSKFMVKTLKRTIFFFAKGETEREVWIESFAKVIEANVAGQSKFNLKSRPQNYLASLDPKTNDGIKHLGTQLRQKRTKVDGVDLYMSQHLEVTKNGFKGDIMKAVENVGVFNYDNYHERFFMLEFGQPYCYFYKNKKSGSFQRSHKQNEILNCHIIQETDLQERLDNRNQKRSSSWFRKQLTDDISRCPWNFPFLLEFSDKVYELHAPTRSDRDQWLNLFSTIAQMNKAGVKTQNLTPFEWLRDQETKKQKEEAGINMTQSARDRAIEDEMEQHLYEQVHLWLRMNQGTMQQHKTVVQDYESENMAMTMEGAFGSCYMLQPPDKKIKSEENESIRGAYRMTKIQMHINSRIQTFLVQRVGVTSISRYTFNELTSVESDDTVLLQSDFETNKVDEANKYCFNLQVKSNPKKLMSCSSEEDRNHWIRCFTLIIQMKNLGIDAGKVNMFSFEQFRQFQLKLAFESKNLTFNSSCISPSVLPIDACELSSTLNQSMNIGGLQPPPTNQQSVRNTSQAIQRLNSVTCVEEQMKGCETATFAMSYRFIEGYLLKEINSTGIFRKTVRHLRYFRIVFTTGKFNIKTCKDESQMRSFQLHDLRSVTVLADPREHPRLIAKATYPMTTHKKTKQLFNVDEVAERPNWPYTFSIEFVERRFDLAARTKSEMHEWLRVFNLIVTLNKIGFSVTEKNPYTFEAQQNDMSGAGSLGATAGRITMQATPKMATLAVQSPNNTQLMKNEQHVDFGIIKSSSMRSTVHENDPDIDNVNTANLALNGDQQNQSVVINSINSNSEFALNVAQNLTQLSNMQIPSTFNRSDDMQPEQPQGQERQGRFHQSTLEDQRSMPSFLNHNITVQNITINQMTMMNNYGTSEQSLKSSVQAEVPVRASSVQPNVDSDSVQVDIERQAEIIQRPISQLSMRAKKKKKKKKMVSIGDYDNNYTNENKGSSVSYLIENQQDLNQTLVSDCNSSAMIGGVKEVDDVTYRSDVIEQFTNAPLVVDSMMHPQQEENKVIENDFGEYQEIESIASKPNARKKKKKKSNTNPTQQENSARSFTSLNNFFSSDNYESKNVAEIKPKPSNTIERVLDFDQNLVALPAESQAAIKSYRKLNQLTMQNQTENPSKQRRSTRSLVEDFNENAKEQQQHQTFAVQDFHGEYSNRQHRAGQEMTDSERSSSGLRNSRSKITADGDQFISLSKVTLVSSSSQARITDRVKDKMINKNYRTLNSFENNQGSDNNQGLRIGQHSRQRNKSNNQFSMERIKQIVQRGNGDSPTTIQSSIHLNAVSQMAIPMRKSSYKKKVVHINRKLIGGIPKLNEIEVESLPALVEHEASWIPKNDGDYDQQASASMMRIEGVKRVDKDDRPFTPAKAILEEIKQDTLRSSNCGDCVIDDWD